MERDREEARPRLVLNGLRATLGDFKLGPIDTVFTVGLHAILGPNGAGKTTLLRAIAGLVERNGAILLDYRDARVLIHRGNAWRLVSSNLIEPPLGFSARVEDYARLVLEPLYGVEWRAEVEAVFSRVGLDWMLGRVWETLSAGQRSMAAMLVAVARRAPVVLLDEPFSHLDPYWRCKALEILLQEARERIVVYTTHEFETPFQADTVTLISEGMVVARGAPTNVLDAELLSKVYSVEFRVIEGFGAMPLCRAGDSRAIH